jgi:hypothetical protein
MTGPYMDDFEDGDAELDALLATARAGIVSKLARAMDLDAGLAAIIAAHNDPSSQTADRATSSDSPAEPSYATDQGAVTAVCDAIAAIVETLTPVCRPDVPAPKGTATSRLSLMAVCRYLSELWWGLSERRLSREQAAGLVDLASHNLTEASRLLVGERARARKAQVRRSIDALIGLVGDTAQQLAELHPRVMRLFHDAGEPTPQVPVPRG